MEETVNVIGEPYEDEGIKPIGECGGGCCVSGGGGNVCGGYAGYDTAIDTNGKLFYIIKCADKMQLPYYQKKKRKRR